MVLLRLRVDDDGVSEEVKIPLSYCGGIRQVEVLVEEGEDSEQCAGVVRHWTSELESELEGACCHTLSHWQKTSCDVWSFDSFWANSRILQTQVLQECRRRDSRMGSMELVNVAENNGLRQR